MRASKATGLVLPSRSTERSCSARSSLAWVAGVSSAISSRNSVPPRAASKRPARAATAPVKAPFSTPNSSASSSGSGTAAQLTATNGPLARAL